MAYKHNVSNVRKSIERGGRYTVRDMPKLLAYHYRYEAYFESTKYFCQIGTPSNRRIQRVGEQRESRGSGPPAPGKSLVVMGILSTSSTDKIYCKTHSFHIYQ